MVVEIMSWKDNIYNVDKVTRKNTAETIYKQIGAG